MPSPCFLADDRLLPLFLPTSVLGKGAHLAGPGCKLCGENTTRLELPRSDDANQFINDFLHFLGLFAQLFGCGGGFFCGGGCILNLAIYFGDGRADLIDAVGLLL